MLIALGAVIAGASAIGTVWFAWDRMHEPYKGYTEPEQFVVIPQGAGSAEIGRRLSDAHVIDDSRMFRVALWWTGRGRSLKAGEYRFDHPISALDVIDVLVRGDVYARRLTFPEGLTIEEMSKIYESHGFGPAREFVEAARDVHRISNLDPEATDLEGYLFPETYALPRGTPASQLVEAMVDRFRAVYAGGLRAQADAQHLTTRQVVTLASLIEKETGQPDERPVVAAVYRNRLTIGMAMQSDPTVVYALEKARRYDGNIHREDLGFDSPYNTYKYPGLPPGPIASPGQASLEVALAPADVRYLYFVSRNEGSHVFAETLREHNANVRKFQVEYFRTRAGRRGRGEGGRAGSGRSQQAIGRE